MTRTAIVAVLVFAGLIAALIYSQQREESLRVSGFIEAASAPMSVHAAAGACVRGD